MYVVATVMHTSKSNLCTYAIRNIPSSNSMNGRVTWTRIEAYPSYVVCCSTVSPSSPFQTPHTSLLVAWKSTSSASYVHRHEYVTTWFATFDLFWSQSTTYDPLWSRLPHKCKAILLLPTLYMFTITSSCAHWVHKVLKAIGWSPVPCHYCARSYITDYTPNLWHSALGSAIVQTTVSLGAGLDNCTVNTQPNYKLQITVDLPSYYYLRSTTCPNEVANHKLYWLKSWSISFEVGWPASKLVDRLRLTSFEVGQVAKQVITYVYVDMEEFIVQVHSWFTHYTQGTCTYIHTYIRTTTLRARLMVMNPYRASVTDTILFLTYVHVHVSSAWLVHCQRQDIGLFGGKGSSNLVVDKP